MKNKNLIFPFGLEGIIDILEEFNGVDKFFKNTKAYTNYPPSNIYSNKEDNTYVIKFAISGWLAEDLNIETESDYKLIVTGNKINHTPKGNFEILHNGIAQREFVKEFSFSESIDNLDVELENGVLTIVVSFKDKKNDKKTFDIKNKNK